MFAINKICIDSSFRVSGTPTEFRIELPESVLIPENTVCMVTDVCIAHSWYSVDDANDRVYVRRVASGLTQDIFFALAHQNYDIVTLAAGLQTAFNARWPTSFTVTASSAMGTLQIATSVADTTFQVLTDAELLDQLDNTWSGTAFEGQSPMTCNMMLRNTIPATSSKTVPFVSGFVDTLAHHNIYISSPNLGSFQNLGPRGERNILKKVVVNVPFGGMITETLINPDDCTDCSKQLLKTLEFKISDIYGNAMQLHGAPVSFSLVFRGSPML